VGVAPGRALIILLLMHPPPDRPSAGHPPHEGEGLEGAAANTTAAQIPIPFFKQRTRHRFCSSSPAIDVTPHSRRRFRARSGRFVPPSKVQRAQGRPGARCTRGLVCKTAQKKTHTSIQVQREHPAFPAQWFTAYNALSPVTGFLATVAGGIASADLMPAPRHQDHTPSPSASGALVHRTTSVHRSPLRVGDVAQRPPVWNGMAATPKADLGRASRKISENQNQVGGCSKQFVSGRPRLPCYGGFPNPLIPHHLTQASGETP